MSEDFPTTPTHYVGFCRLCGTGPLGLRTCGDCGALTIVCDECDAVWPDAELAAPPATTGTTTLPCPHCGSDLYEPPAHWATDAELAAVRWLGEAIEAGRLELKTRGGSH
ncbi:hypothetical protein [Aeoliella mucimassa]|uniref:Uncharacterized protein n=1 Tax=Aeoliella mucimassa TaxID=2527972 RepID=A0A518ARF9_9BACT|nr:hypothetical protein [Aeoliella mucimassa]QDU57308.1 hypothetical protein Pan181_35230 [Aeoliella mucimassa]